MARATTFVIVGAGLAGAKAAETLRDEGFDGRVVLVGSETERPYERPPLSKGYLAGSEPREKSFVHDEAFYTEREIELRTGTEVTALDVGIGEVELAGGERLRYDRLLLATGAEPRRLAVPGAGLPGVHHLRTLADADALSERFAQGGRVLVVGAGWIGAEVAATARGRGLDVVMLERGQRPLERVLGPELGEFYARLHRDHGVELLAEAELAALEGGDAVARARLADGRTIDCDLVVAGIGVEPRTGLAEGAGIEVWRGILTDDRLETSAQGVFAAGDVAAAWHPFYDTRLQVEHWANALNQGPAAARSMLGVGGAYDRVPYFFSDQYDVGMEYTGHPSASAEVAFRGDPASREFVAFWLESGRVSAAMGVNVWDAIEPAKELIRSRRPVDLGRLLDPGVPLAELAAPVSA
jgi:3-phenylpropionate/trans-cinnamate dioxygenase ferredoxin reductase component